MSQCNIKTVIYLFLFLFLTYTAAQEDESAPTQTPETDTTTILEKSTDAADSDDEALNMCADYDFPDEEFQQKDVSKVYTNVETLKSGPFFDSNMTKYATVFGVRVIGENAVEDEKISHLANVLAQFLDNDQDGIPDHDETVEILRERRATLFLVKDPTMPERLLSAEEDEGFPPALKECPFAFDFEVSDRIKLDVENVEEDCETSVGTGDRSLGFVSDHIVGRSWPMFMTHGADNADFEKLESLFDKAVENGDFDIEVAGCPEDDLEYCGFVMFSSWAATSYLGVDKCWCEDTGAWKLCSPEKMKEKAPELFEFLQNKLKTKPDGNYTVE